MHSHILIPSTKKDICYCKICSKLSYKGIMSKELHINFIHKFDIDPLKFKFKPISVVANYKSLNHIKYLESKKIGINKIKYLVDTFGFNSMVLYKSINFMNQIFLENEISTENIENIASICVLLVTQFNECCLPSMFEDYITKNENDLLFNSRLGNKKNNELLKEKKIKYKSNLCGLFNYIKKNVNNYKYWEIFCLKKLNYDLGRYSAYDYLILFFDLGICFCREEINMLELLKYSVNILYFITNDRRSCEYNQYTLAMSIIKVALENHFFFDKNVFKYIYGVDLSKKKYLNCSNMVKAIINLSYNRIDNSINIEYNNNNLVFQLLCINKYLDNHTNKGNNNDNNNNLRNIISCIIKNNIIINNGIINNNISIKNNNIYYQNLVINNYNNFIGNTLGITNTDYLVNLNNFQNSENNCIYESN